MTRKKQVIGTEWQIPEHRVDQFRLRKTKYCLIIPVINEGKRFLGQLQKVQPYSDTVDIIIADGGSTDGSTEVDRLAANGVRTLLTKTSPGKLSSQLRMAYAYALQQGYDGSITIDGNGKDGVDGIGRMIDGLTEGFDYIQGSRYLPGGEAVNTPLIRHLANHYLHAPVLSIASGHWFTDTTNGFRAYSRNYLLDPRVQPFRDIFTRYELLAYLTVRASQIGMKVKEVPVSRRYPKGEVPTKISSVHGNIDLLQTLILAAFGYYNPA